MRLKDVSNGSGWLRLFRGGSGAFCWFRYTYLRYV
jgi:hypothetical protein